jgi:pyridinium-3,5-biscarboxylic acid mononucleotide sulfurtransferase
MTAPLTPYPADKLEALRRWLAQHPRLAVAYSGGVDSSLLLRVATEVLGKECVGLLAVSPSLSESERKQAVELAEVMGAKLKLIHTTETEDPRYKANAPNRCYFCKDNVYAQLSDWAESHSITHLADGMNVEDTLDVRPGRAAAKERGVLSPLHELGFTKMEIRAAAKHLGLSNWNKPAAACLASRIPYGTPVTVELLSQVEQAESALHALGFREMRVRHHGELARVEVPEEDFDPIMQKRERIITALKATGYTYVTLDLQGLRMGSMNEVLANRA